MYKEIVKNNILWWHGEKKDDGTVDLEYKKRVKGEEKSFKKVFKNEEEFMEFVAKNFLKVNKAIKEINKSFNQLIQQNETSKSTEDGENGEKAIEEKDK